MATGGHSPHSWQLNTATIYKITSWNFVTSFWRIHSNFFLQMTQGSAAEFLDGCLQNESHLIQISTDFWSGNANFLSLSFKTFPALGVLSSHLTKYKTWFNHTVFWAGNGWRNAFVFSVSLESGLREQNNGSLPRPPVSSDVRSSGVWQGGISSGAADVWGDRQRAVWRQRQRRRDSPGASGGVSAVGHAFPTPEVTRLSSDDFVKLFGRRQICECVCSSHPGSWGLNWWIPVMRASSGTLPQGKETRPAAPQEVRRAWWRSRKKTAEVEQSESEPDWPQLTGLRFY